MNNADFEGSYLRVDRAKERGEPGGGGGSGGGGWSGGGGGGGGGGAPCFNFQKVPLAHIIKPDTTARLPTHCSRVVWALRRERALEAMGAGSLTRGPGEATRQRRPMVVVTAATVVTVAAVAMVAVPMVVVATVGTVDTAVVGGTAAAAAVPGRARVMTGRRGRARAGTAAAIRTTAPAAMAVAVAVAAAAGARRSTIEPVSARKRGG